MPPSGQALRCTVTAALMSAAYELVPTDENINSRAIRPSKARINRTSLFKALAISVAFCLISFVSYKAGQWSVEHRPLSTQEPVTVPPEGDTELDFPAKSPSQDTNMPGNGKYSVG